MKKLKSKHSQSGARRKQIIKAGLDCFNEMGFTATSILEICNRSGSSAGSIYHHFKSKEQLAAAIYLEGIKDYQAGFIEELQRHNEAQDGIYAVISYYLKWVEKQPDWARYLFHKKHAEFMGAAEDDLKRMNAEFIKRVSEWFMKHIKAGTIKRLPPEVYQCIIIGPCHEYSRFYLSGHVSSSIENAAEEFGRAAWLALAVVQKTKIKKEE